MQTLYPVDTQPRRPQVKWGLNHSRPLLFRLINSGEEETTLQMYFVLSRGPFFRLIKLNSGLVCHTGCKEGRLSIAMMAVTSWFRCGALRGVSFFL